MSLKDTEIQDDVYNVLNGDFDLRYSSNEHILNSLGYGINAITLKNGTYNDELLKNVMHEIIATHIEFSNDDLLNEKGSWFKWKALKENISGSFRFDPITCYVKKGQWEQSKESELNNWINFHNESTDLDFESWESIASVTEPGEVDCLLVKQNCFFFYSLKK